MTWSVCLSAFLDYNSEFSSLLVDHVPCMNRVVNGEGLRGIPRIKRDVKGSKFPEESVLKFVVLERHVIAVRFTYCRHRDHEAPVSAHGDQADKPARTEATTEEIDSSPLMGRLAPLAPLEDASHHRVRTHRENATEHGCLRQGRCQSFQESSLALWF